MRSIACVVAIVLAVPLIAAEKKKPPTGTICIAPFHVSAENPARGPNMSTTTWGPAADSKFELRVGKTIKATAANHEMVTIRDVPADRSLMVGIRLDGKPFESFRIDLRKEPNRRLCLWLYEDYWHWVDMGWDEQKGCRCS